MIDIVFITFYWVYFKLDHLYFCDLCNRDTFLDRICPNFELYIRQTFRKQILALKQIGTIELSFFKLFVYL